MMNNSDAVQTSFKPITSVNDLINKFKEVCPWAFPDDQNGFDSLKFQQDEAVHRFDHDFHLLNPVGRIHSFTFGNNP